MEDITSPAPDSPAPSPSRRGKRLGWAATLIAGGALAGVVVASALPAAADPSPAATTSGSTSTTSSSSSAGQPGRNPGGQRSDETLLTGTDAEKAKAAALKAVPGATIDRVETDADGGGVYEAHITRSDGSRATVLFDKDFNVVSVADGMGPLKK